MKITAVKYDLGGNPPNLTGTLQKNFALTEAERYKLDELNGPESFVYYKGHIYTGLADGRIVDISDCGVQTIARLAPPTCAGGVECARPLGMRMDNFGRLVVADSARGIFRINLQKGFIETLYSSNTPVNGRRCKFINDVVLARDGTILFTDSSARWTRKEFLYIVLEGEATGRLLAYSDKSNKTIVVLDKLAFPNGLELGPGDDYLLIAETGRARIRRLSLKPGKTWLQLTSFAENLPGLPDNIRSSGRGTYWVAMSQARHSNMTSMIDEYASQPQMREMVAMMSPMDQILAMSEKYGMIVELDGFGKIIRSLQDPTGLKISAVSEVMEKDGFLYLGNFDRPYVSRVPLSEKFDVERFLSKIKSTCRATKMNLTKVRTVLKRLVAIAELRKFLLATRKKVDEGRMKLTTTTVTPTSTAAWYAFPSTTTAAVEVSTTSSNTTTQSPTVYNDTTPGMGSGDASNETSTITPLFNTTVSSDNTTTESYSSNSTLSASNSSASYSEVTTAAAVWDTTLGQQVSTQQVVTVASTTATAVQSNTTQDAEG
ncbi:hypothetical protein Btru_018549 [Bulinus truncatus]|nr:hypothetical protein Btru_018549 [Bulinus truncatus]